MMSLRKTKEICLFFVGMGGNFLLWLSGLRKIILEVKSTEMLNLCSEGWSSHQKYPA